MEIVIGIVAVVIAILTFKYSFFRKPKEELNNLKILFRATQNLSKEVQQNLTLYIKDNNASYEILFGDITCIKYLNIMKEAYDKYLADELLNELDSLKLTRPNIASLSQSLEKQFQALQEVRGFLELKNK